MAALIITGEAIFLLPFIVMRVFKPIIRDVFRISDFEIGEAQALYGKLPYFPIFLEDSSLTNGKLKSYCPYR